MELQEFVKDTLLAIMNGVIEAQASEFPDDGSIGHNTETSDYVQMEEVRFTVALGETTSGGKGAKIGVALPMVGDVGASGNKKREVSSTTNVSFSVPIRYPVPRK